MVLAAWDAGEFFPRLVDEKGAEPDACRFCDVAEACLRGDSGARARLAAWTGAQHDDPSSLLALWRLPAGGTP